MSSLPHSPTLKQEPYKLPEGYAWSELDITKPNESKEVYDLLNRNYVEDDDNMFRFDYSPAFLEWALSPPGSSKNFIIGIRVVKTGKLVGCITGVPVEMRVYDKKVGPRKEGRKEGAGDDLIKWIDGRISYV